ncbi:hypothetical protein CASFOL_003733 [Castilleja foliolosa]|uniref:Uncharacterized protein n=1 Tax=Castilleja foliolosa TaxID=1961234 RepID=A0ABD3EJW1_9LAMI
MQKSDEEKQIPLEKSLLEAEISQELLTHLKLNDVKKEEDEALDNHGGDEDEEVEEEEEDEDEEEEEEFSFFCGGANTSPISADDIFSDGQIRPVYPLFNRDLFFSGEDLPARPSVMKLFVETSEETGSVASSSKGNPVVSGPHCEWSDRKAVEVSPPSPETCKKSNSTGFSKIWRFKDLLGRSNSDGRDTFVFLNNGNAPPAQAPSSSAATEKPVVKRDGKKGLKEKVKGKGKKVKTASLSAHEVYLKSKGTKEERRRSYLPYRPELMGFFTNVNGGLSKNVHPF